MTERKRLTTNEKYPHGAEGVSKDKLTGKYCRGVFEATACVEKLAEYETAEEEGRLVVIPYKIGMTLFLPRRREVLPFKVVGTRIYTNRTEIDLVYCGNNECYKFLSTHPTTEYIEREYYKTREEAKKALKEMEGK